MKWLYNHRISLLVFICVLCIIANAVVLYIYHSIFNGDISKELNSWNLFILVFNGLITAILTVVNIVVFININRSIEDNNENRQVRNILNDAQTILAKMRFDEYTFIKELINDIKLSIYQKHLPTDKIMVLKKKLIAIDNSFLYKNQNLHDEPFLRPIALDLVKQLDNFVKKTRDNKLEESDVEGINDRLSDFLNIMEFQIITQLVRSKNVEEYISDHQDEIDCTISCIYEFAKEIHDGMKVENN